MEGYCIGEKEYFSSEEISLYIKDSEDNLHYCEKGAFVLTNQRIIFQGASGV
jgi:hypothetical protein